MKYVWICCIAGFVLVTSPSFAAKAKVASGSVAQSAQKQGPGRIAWQQWSDDVFAQAKKSNRYVLLDLEAIWCHWCHVMDEKTYKNPAIIKLVNERFIPVRVDQDSRPDLSNRYDDYGWPATVVFDPSGKERAIWSGFFPPQEMMPMLRGALKEKSIVQLQPKQTTTVSFISLPATLKKELTQALNEGYDTDYGGWGFGQKFLNWDCVEYAMAQARAGDQTQAKRARDTLGKQLNLIDPVWGGVYQYSTDNDWEHPHFEKIMQMQAENLRIYSQAYEQWHAPEYLKAAKDIERFLSNFLLSPEGAFYTSQDADLVQGKHSGEYFALDDVQRRKQGMPRIDKHIYARENGWAINALTNLYMATGDRSFLQKAQQAADWIIGNRSIEGGGFRHDATDPAGPYLGDSLSMGRAFLTLYTATADKVWLEHASEVALFINKHFCLADKSNLSAGFATADVTRNTLLKPAPLLDENVNLARFTNLLYRYTGKPIFRTMAEEAIRFAERPEIARKPKVFVAGVLLADLELNSDPPHVTVVGPKSDPQARALFQAAISCPQGYKRIEWWDPAEGPLPNMDVEYPQLKQAAAFTCVDGRCSSPISQPELILTRLESNKAKSPL